MKTLLSILIWVFTALMTLGVFLGVLLLKLWPFDRQKRLSHALGYWWAEAITRVNPFWRMKVAGLKHFSPKRSYVIVANHQSMSDIALVYLTHRQFKWVAKESLFKVPVFGWCMSGMKYIKLMRGEFSSIKDVYQEAAYWLKKDMSVLFFPEGTRSTTGELSAFKNGAFKLAIKEQKPVLPLAISGTRNILPKGSWVFKNKVTCELKVLPAIETKDYSEQDFDLLKDKVRGEICASLKENEK
ncbi:MAG: lysophospholipid acyltransferase family protein [Candidatus Omnitrophica bacterium]|nr:lysophospholipid acyltransferase family protein [Candidatus Omnitrophota bacterium]